MGAYCQFCDRRCFVVRTIASGPRAGWTGCLATCPAGMAHDRATTGHDHTTAEGSTVNRNIITAADVRNAKREQDRRAQAERRNAVMAFVAWLYDNDYSITRQFSDGSASFPDVDDIITEFTGGSA